MILPDGAAALPLAAEAGLALRDGKLVVAVNAAANNGKGAGLLLWVAALSTEETVNTSILWGRGLTCFSVTAERAMALGLVLSGAYRDGYHGPILLRSVEAADCEGTGISAADRALTLRAAGAETAGMGSLKSPGHVMPVMIGYRGRQHDAPADMALDLVKVLADREVAAWTDILDDDGERASSGYCAALADKLGLVCLDVVAVFGAGVFG